MRGGYGHTETGCGEQPGEQQPDCAGGSPHWCVALPLGSAELTDRLDGDVCP
ncbi:hypothetical protein SHJG_6636 [Streptomyces hygroscopicus subsp. jinggangensis 5008]|nr:hypothetical protein SHJG_6636 [Streptomyces hygroscopicus subsp. jinggangensis 5008]AGF66059.1 hypothetical protein SHJGH_6396 [Streptomyces hygroscopicus subsp. jinggangensis TL01]